LLPAAYFSMPVTSQISAGLGINAPFGLKTEYDSGWVGRFNAIKSDVKTINVNPSVAFKVNNTVSLGLGLNYQRLDAEFTNGVDASAALAQAIKTPGSPLAPFAPLLGAGALNGLEGSARIKGDDYAWGWNIGALFQVSPSMRIGASYRSALTYHVTGDISFSNPTIVAGGPISPVAAGILNGALASGILPNGSVKADIKLPDTAILSAYQKLSDQWEMMGDVLAQYLARRPRRGLHLQQSLEGQDRYRL
jgi:long-chain fatty acid transport protein